MSNPWFGRKRIGFGIRPTGGMGWLVTIVWAVLLFAAVHLFRAGVIPSLPLFIAVEAVIVIGFALIIIAKSEHQ